MSLALDKNIGGTRLAPGDVDLANPLDTTQGLLDGVQGFWLPLPSTAGGGTVYGLPPYNYPLSNQGNVSVKAHPAQKHPVLYFPGNTGDKLVINALPWSTSDPFTILFSAVDSVSFYDTSPRVNYHVVLDSNNGLSVETELGDGRDNLANVGNLGLSPNRLHDFAYVYNQGQQRVYVDGSIKINESNTANFLDQTEDHVLTLGQLASSTKVNNNSFISFNAEEYVSGYIGYILFLKRPMSSNEISSFHNQARRGFPTLLNTRSRIFGFAGTGGAVSLAPTDTQQPYTLDSAGFGVGYGLAPSGLSQTQVLEQAGVTVAYSLAPADSLQGHTLEASSLGSLVVLSPTDVQHGHTLEGTLLEVSYTLAASGLSHGHTVGKAGLNVLHVLAPSGMSHAHALEQTAIILPSDAAFIDVSVRPKYTIDVSAKPKIQ